MPLTGVAHCWCWTLHLYHVPFSYLTSPSPVWWSTTTPGRRLAPERVWWTDRLANWSTGATRTTGRTQQPVLTPAGSGRELEHHYSVWVALTDWCEHKTSANAEQHVKMFNIRTDDRMLSACDNYILAPCCCHSDEEMEEANPIEAHDSDYDPNKETKKEVCGHAYRFLHLQMRYLLKLAC